jgi:hypothetical protein
MEQNGGLPAVPCESNCGRPARPIICNIYVQVKRNNGDIVKGEGGTGTEGIQDTP